MAVEKNEQLDADKELLAKEKDLEKRLENYRDVEGVTTKRLNLGIWYLRHRRTFFLGLVWFLAIIATVLWCYSLYYFGYYLLIGAKQERILNQDINDAPPQAIKRDLSANFSFKTIDIINLGNGRFDLLGEVNNQNPRSWADYEYYFLVDGEKIGISSGYVLPQSKKYLTAILDDRVEAPNSAVLVVAGIKWSNINTHQIPDWNEYKNLRLDFSIRDKKFVSSNSSFLSERLPLNTLSFEIVNDTAFGYVEAPLQIILYSGDEIVGVKDYIVNRFKARERRNVNMTVAGKLPSITNILIIPDINILADSVYLKLN